MPGLTRQRIETFARYARVLAGRRRRLGALAGLIALAVCLGRAAGSAAPATLQPESASHIVELHIDGEIEPVVAEYIGDGIDRANRDGAALILITIDTPGGLDTSMRAIIQHILDSAAPVAVYVTPAGSRAASAGFFILLAADIAAMAPGTHTGAASPLLAIGGYPIEMDETLKQKILNDATAYLRSYASRRGRAVAAAETAVTEAKAFTEQEAFNDKLIDLVSPSREALFASLDGRSITRFDGRSSILALARPDVVTIEMSTRQRLLARIVQPDVFFVLLIVAVLGLYAEFTHPGLVAPGVIGGIALVLAMFGMHLLPINVTGLLLIGLALALFILEANYPSHGILGAGGLIAMLLGAVMLVRSPLTGGGVSLGLAMSTALPFALIAIVLMRLVLRSRAWTPQTGVEALVQETGLVTEPIGSTAAGRVLVRGELWRARSTSTISNGARVRIVGVDGLTLHVEPITSPDHASAAAPRNID
jgi:membrane-bound serine protease (ClpP class)